MDELVQSMRSGHPRIAHPKGQAPVPVSYALNDRPGAALLAHRPNVIVSFETNDLRSTCSSLEAAECELGTAGARALLSVLSEIEALENANEFLELAVDDATISSSNAIEVAVGREHRAVLIPVGVRFRSMPDGSPDWTTVQRLKLTALSRCV